MKHTVYHRDGSLWANGFLTKGKMDRYWEWFRKDGSMMRSGYFKLGKRVGKWTTYDKKGAVYKVTLMKNEENIQRKKSKV